MCVRGYIDLGTYFMSVVHEVQWKVEQWAGVPPDVTAVMKALREGLGEELPSLQGRYETGYGLSDRFPIEQGLGQGRPRVPPFARTQQAHAGRDAANSQ